MATDARAQWTRISVATDGTQANASSDMPSISADGRYVAFSSTATNLVANDTNGSSDIFVRDRINNITTRVSMTSDGLERTGDSTTPQISANGRFIVFLSRAPLVADDTQTCDPSNAGQPKCQDVYVHDRETGATTRVSVSSANAQADADSYEPHISGDGTFVVFESEATNLVTDDTNPGRDAFLHDRTTGATSRLVGMPGFSHQFGEPEPRISDDGRFVAFTGWVPPGSLPNAPGCWQLSVCPATFVQTIATGTVELVSSRLAPVETPPGSVIFADEPASLSADGRLLIVKQVTIQPSANPLQSDARYSIYDRVTGGIVTLPWRSTGSPADVIASSSDARYYALVGPTANGHHERIFHDRVAALDESLLIPTSPGSDDDSWAMSMSHEARYVAFVTRTPLVGADTNSLPDIYVLDRDTDGDGLPSAWETRFGLNPDAPSAADDPDHDGVTNLQEFQRGSQPDKGFTRYLAEGAANGFMTTRLAIVNPQDTTVEAAFRLLGSSGNRTTLFRTLAPRSRQTIVLAQGGPAPENDFATVIESTQPIVVDRTMTWDARRFGAHAETSVDAPATTWYLAEGATHGAFDLFYLLLNATGTDATATVKYLRPAPLAPVMKTYGVPANGRLTIYVDEQGPELAETDVSAVVTADQPIVVERAQYASTPAQPFAAGHDGAGLTAPALTWFLAEGATGQFFDMYVLLANPGTETSNVTVKYLLESGASFTKNYTVAGESRLTIGVDGEDPRLADTPVSMIVSSTNNQPIVVERAMWWPSPNWYEAHLAAGTTTTGTMWALAEGETQTIAGEDQKETYILIANTGTTDGTATITLLVEGGQPIALSVPVRAESRVSVPTAGLFPPGSHANFGAIIDSHGLPIVVERAMYSTVDNVTWAAGTAAVGTKLQ